MHGAYLGSSGTPVLDIGYVVAKYTTFCGGINEDGERKSKNIIKYIC